MSQRSEVRKAVSFAKPKRRLWWGIGGFLMVTVVSWQETCNF